MLFLFKKLGSVRRFKASFCFASMVAMVAVEMRSVSRSSG